MENPIQQITRNLWLIRDYLYLSGKKEDIGSDQVILQEVKHLGWCWVWKDCDENHPHIFDVIARPTDWALVNGRPRICPSQCCNSKTPSS